MRILHLCLSCFYIDGYNYQENNLPRINAEDGNEVRIIASTVTFKENNKIGFCEPKEYLTEYNVPILRLPYKKIGNQLLTNRIRCYPGLYGHIDSFSPDVIMSHGLSYWSLLDVIKYIQKHRNVKFYADTHTDYYTSGTNWISLNLLHRFYYKRIIHKALPYLDKYFYITEECKEFSIKEYKMPESLMEFYPLGGEYIEDSLYLKYRENTRKQFNIHDELLFVHAGKIEPRKKTKELLNAFINVPNLHAKLVIAGSLDPEIQDTIMKLVDKDERIIYVGWKNSDDLIHLLCGGDLYCQPGKVSSIMQNAVSCRCPVMVFPYSCYTGGYNYGNEIFVKEEKDIEDVFRRIISGDIKLNELRENSKRCAKELLDYRSLAARLYR